MISNISEVSMLTKCRTILSKSVMYQCVSLLFIGRLLLYCFSQRLIFFLNAVMNVCACESPEFKDACLADRDQNHSFPVLQRYLQQHTTDNFLGI